MSSVFRSEPLALRGRLHTFDVAGGVDRATFRDAETARMLRERVAALIGATDVAP